MLSVVRDFHAPSSMPSNFCESHELQSLWDMNVVILVTTLLACRALLACRDLYHVVNMLNEHASPLL